MRRITLQKRWMNKVVALCGGVMTLLSCFIAGTLNAQEQTKLLILHTNDTHSRIEPAGSELENKLKAGKGGFVRRATYIKEERLKDPDLLLVDCGDFSQGTPYYNLFKGEVEIEMMNAMKYDVMTIGNHEFDFGLENMHRLYQLAKFPVVCCNYDFTGTVLEGMVKPYIIIHRKGVKIGIFGVSPQLKGLVQEKNYKGVVFQDPYKRANEVAAHLKEDEKCDVVICLSHLGWEKGRKYAENDIEFIAQTRNIDLVLGGHSHSRFDEVLFYENLDGRQTPLNQAWEWGLAVGRVTITLDKE